MAKVKMKLEQYDAMRTEIADLKKRVEWLEMVRSKNAEFDRKVEGLLYPLYKEARDKMREEYPVLEKHNRYSVSVPVGEILKLWTFDEFYEEDEAEEEAKWKKENGESEGDEE